MQAGKFDLPLDVGIIPSSYQQLDRPTTRSSSSGRGSAPLPYLVFNFQSPNDNHAIQNVKLRQAIEYGVNKVAVQKVLGGPPVAKVINTAIPPGTSATRTTNRIPARAARAIPPSARLDARQRGVQEGHEADYMYQNDSVIAADFQACRPACGACGMNLAGQAGVRRRRSSSTWATPRPTPRRVPGTWVGLAGSLTGSATTAAPSSDPLFPNQLRAEHHELRVLQQPAARQA